MATQDDKISDKRRRLFKALSAAPVVATLRPGDALANASSLQCAANIRSDLTLNPGPVTQGSTEAGDFLYVDLLYWELTQADRIEVDGEKVRLTGIAVSRADVPLTVVRVPDPTSGDSFFELNGSLFENRFTTPAYFTVTGTTLALYNSDGDLAASATGQTAGFAKVIRTGSKEGVVDRLIMDDGTFPETQLSQLTGAGPGEPQGITGTCLGSFVTTTADNGGIRTLSIG